MKSCVGGSPCGGIGQHHDCRATRGSSGENTEQCRTFGRFSIDVCFHRKFHDPLMHPLFVQHQQTLLGRLKTRLLTKLSQSNERVPSDRQVWRFLMQEWKTKPETARFTFYLLYGNQVNRIEIPARTPRPFVQRLLRNTYLIDRTYCEG